MPNTPTARLSNRSETKPTEATKRRRLNVEQEKVQSLLTGLRTVLNLMTTIL